MMTRKRLCFLFFVVLAYLCIQSETIYAQTSNKKMTGGWQIIDTGPFTIQLPQGWVFNKLQGMDSYVGNFVGDGIRLSFDYGWYSNGLEDKRPPEYVVTLEVINGHRAKIVFPKVYGGKGLVGIHFPSIVGIHFPSINEDGTRLTVTASKLNKLERNLVINIFRTIRFKKEKNR